MEAVRTATSGDAPRLAELAGALLDELGNQRGGGLLIDRERTPPSAAGLARWLGAVLADPARAVLVGTIDGVVVGWALSSTEDLGGHGRRGRLEVCFVEEGARGVGVGRLLLERSLEWLGGEGCLGVDGVALPGDRTAKNFFESAGFKARVLTMFRALG
jgi:GNAT superfamily N-acetyltransferase